MMHRETLAHRLVITLAAVALFSACGGRQTSLDSYTFDPEALNAGPLLPAAAAGRDFFHEQEITVSWPEGEREFSAVLQKVDDTLSVVALGPMGRPAFRIQLYEGEVTMEAYTDRTLPFPPEYIIADVQKAFFSWFPTSDTLADGTRAGTFEELQFDEEIISGKTVKRTFSRSDAPDAGRVNVSYSNSQGSGPSDVTVENGWFGYSLRVITTRSRDL